jgi:hypothetical protein
MFLVFRVQTPFPSIKPSFLNLARSNPLRDQENWTTAAGDIIHTCPDIVETFDQLE